MTAHGRPSRQLERLAADLSQRDWSILHDLGRVRLLTGRLIQRLHVAEGSPLTQARRTRSCLQRLFDLGLVVRLERRVGGVRAGSAGYTYALSTTGQRLVTKHGPAGGERLRRPWEPRAAFVDHILEVSKLYVELVEASRIGVDLELLDFAAEPAAWRRWSGATGERLILKPDGCIIVASGDEEHLTFLELDRSTESLPVIRKKALVYIDYWRSGREQAADGLGVFPQVLFVVPDPDRQRGVIDTLSRLDPESWQLFRVVRRAEALEAITGRPPPDTAITANHHTS